MNNNNTGWTISPVEHAFHAFTLNEEWSFQALKRMEKQIILFLAELSLYHLIYSAWLIFFYCISVFPLLYLAVSHRTQKIHMWLIYVCASSNYGGQFAVEMVRWNAACEQMNLIQRPWKWKKHLLRKDSQSHLHISFLYFQTVYVWKNLNVLTPLNLVLLPPRLLK